MERILAVDDNRDNLISLRAIIKDVFPDAYIDTALNGTDGIRLAKEKDPDVILLDILMPEIDGFEVCRQLKQDSYLRDIPVVFLTAIKQNKESRIEALEVGAEAFLSKPIDVPELTAQIRAMIKIKESNKQKRDEKEHLALLVAERTHELEKSHREMLKLVDDLKFSEMRYRRLFESATDGILIINPETEKIVDVNQFLIDLLGYSRDYLIGRKFWDVGALMNVLASRVAFAKFKKIGYTRIDDLPIKSFDGRIIHVELVSNIYFADKVKVVQSNIRDITERRKTEEQVKTLGKAIEQGPSSIVITNQKGKIEFVNKKFISNTQYHFKEVKGKYPRVFNPGHLSEKNYEDLWKKIQKGITWRGEVQNRRKDKTLYWEDTIISALINPGNNTICNYVLIMNDMTEKKQMLDDLIVAKEKAEESDRLKSAFLANISHEIRTPLNCIIGFSDLLLDPKFDMGKKIEFARMINSSGINMLSMFNDILDISKIEAGQLAIKKDVFSVNRLVSNVQKEYSYKAAEKGLTLGLDFLSPTKEIYINSDASKLKQILVNLVVNAIKFSKDGHIEIGFKAKENVLEFHVKDAGIGIPKEYHEKIFDRFRQVESDYTREYGGNGLGLAISKSIVEMLGGKIWLDSEVGLGSVFYFTIPG
ncbi:MAG: ATP-binding protein [Bacteroidales bacterium]|nr:ATP-binding protein [Bacteroidales bacterium]